MFWANVTFPERSTVARTRQMFMKICPHFHSSVFVIPFLVLI